MAIASTLQSPSPASFTGRKIAFVVNDASFFLSHRLVLGRAALLSGAQVLVIAPADDPRSEASIRDEGFEFAPLQLSKFSFNPLDELQAIRSLTQLYRTYRPDLVHHVTIKPVLYGSLAARMCHIPAMVNAISGLGYVFISDGMVARFRRALVYQLYRFASGHPNQRTIFQNPEDSADFLNRRLVCREQIIQIRGSGVNTEVFAPSAEPEGPIRILMASRLLWEKGIAEFVEAARRIRQQRSGVEFIVAGARAEGNPQSVSAVQLAAWQDEANVTFLGARDDIAELLKKSHIACLPSYREGLPLALIEAASSGRPIVATNVPGCREIVRDGDNGLLVEPQNVDQLEAALMKLIDDASLRDRFGRRGREMVLAEGFARDAVVRQTLDVYQALLST